jgi:SAM-dependent methyltransferase
MSVAWNASSSAQYCPHRQRVHRHYANAGTFNVLRAHQSLLANHPDFGNAFVEQPPYVMTAMLYFTGRPFTRHDAIGDQQMKFIKIDPPGAFCTNEALRDLVKRAHPSSFVDVGCGGGDISKMLCSIGMRGAGIDFSPLAIETTSERLREEIASGRYTLIEGDATEVDCPIPKSDLGISYMVMEHVVDDVNFVKKLATLVRPQGMLAICVPGRKD